MFELAEVVAETVMHLHQEVHWLSLPHPLALSRLACILQLFPLLPRHSPAVDLLWAGWQWNDGGPGNQGRVGAMIFSGGHPGVSPTVPAPILNGLRPSMLMSYA